MEVILAKGTVNPRSIPGEEPSPTADYAVRKTLLQYRSIAYTNLGLYPMNFNMLTMKPKKEKFEEKQTLILKYAIKLLIQGGSRLFSMRSLANHCGITLGNLQYYFPNLESLFEGVFNQVIEDATTRLQLANAEHNELDVLLDIIVNNLQDMSLCTLALETWLASRHSEKLHKILTKFYQRYTDQVIIILRNTYADMSEDIRKEKALMLVSLFEGLSMLYSYRNKDSFNFDLSQRLRSTIIAIIEAK
ncbi:HTH-type transcriptional regulator MtrR [Xenorhabdus beddingii]|uniref:HTH-type transcriptional regulator MtrR n=1 Tax=Xenorhabdus beddingii TaxID=40578 RepID=A0A1Y2SKN1_9GAMM|nr:helix-turn-helix domain-containing protein [Xenorhabdus beddingii]OTA19050.1 HTH-type transcriptional regulator MtrR [Xenorhabdus beddingii]